MKIALVGDSAFDNGRYVHGGEPDMAGQLGSLLGAASSVWLGARDGARTADVVEQLARLPVDATHVVVSAGGNDAIGYLDLLEARTSTVADALGLLADTRDDFGVRYGALLSAVREQRRPALVCTVYDPLFPDRQLQRVAVAGLAVLNDVIVRCAFAASIPVLDLRLVCTEASDLANPIEPSAQGGAKIAAAILRALRATRDTGGGFRLFGP